MARIADPTRAARAWPRAAVWGGALASTAMNFSSNWHATTSGGLTTFIAPTANGLHLPEVTKLVVSAAFPLLLIFAVESAARTSLRFAWNDLGSYAMPAGAAVVFAFSVGEVTRLLLGMGQPPVLALLFALAPDILITAGTVVLMRERAAFRDAVPKREAPAVPDVPASRPIAGPRRRWWRRKPMPPYVFDVDTAPGAEPPGLPVATVVPMLAPASPPPREVEEAAGPEEVEQESSRSRPTKSASQEATVTQMTGRSEEEVFAAIREYSQEHGRFPTANWLKNNRGPLGASRAEKLLKVYREREADGREETG